MSYRRITKRGETKWILDYADSAGRHQVDAVTPAGDRCQAVRDVVRAANAVHERLVKGITAQPSSMTINEWVAAAEFDDWITARRQAPATIRRNLDALKAMRKSGIAERMVSRIGRREIDAHVAERVKAGRAAETVNNDLKFLKLCLRAAEDHGLIESMPRIPYLPVRPDPPRILSPEEFQAIMAAAAADRWDGAACLVGLWGYAGLRQQEGASCLRSWVDLGRMVLTVAATKTGRVEPVPIVPPLDALLSARLAAIPPEQEELFPGATHSVCRRLMLRLSAAAGVGNATPHMLRHSVGQMLTAMGVPMAVTMAVLRHRSMKISLRYQAVNLDSARDALARRSGWIAAGSQPGNGQGRKIA